MLILNAEVDCKSEREGKKTKGKEERGKESGRDTAGLRREDAGAGS